MLKKVLLILFLCVSATTANAAPAEINAYVPNAKKVNQVVYKGEFTSYAAILYAQKGHFESSKPYAISFIFDNEMKGSEFAAYAADKIRENGFKDELRLGIWQQKMQDIFPDVDKGSVLTAIYDKNQFTLFLDGDTYLADIKDKEFSERFFDVWLGSNAEHDLVKK